MLTHKQLGIVMMIAAVVLLVIGTVYINKAEAFILSHAKTGPEGECVHEGPVCPYEEVNRLAVPKFVSAAVLLILFASGAFLSFRKTPQEAAQRKARTAAKGLGSDEAKVFDLVVAANGMIFQNELVDKTQLSKVKMTRVLDKLEAKGLVERRRRGMTNVVILKQ